MMQIFAHAVTALLTVGFATLIAGAAFARFTHLKVGLTQPDFWKSFLYFFPKRIAFHMRVAQLAHDAENTTRSGRIADWFLKRGTVLLVIGGIAKAVLFFMERQTP